tara:strand:- start:2537 stop:3052 length:516 start_codon:yes stop_codon:yes gene_type:complete
MRLTRRTVLVFGGGAIATLATASQALARQVEVIEMRGSPRGEQIWFSPHGLAVTAGTVVRFVNRDPGNSHTATAYHPDFFGRERRIPAAATPWDSGFLLPDESYEVTLDAPGVYDFYCIPHEMAAMVGRIVVGRPSDAGWEGPSSDASDIEPEALAALPSVSSILVRHRVE